MYRKSLVFFLNLILIFTLVFAWTYVGTKGGSLLTSGGSHTSSGLITGDRGRLHPISSTPVGEKGVEITGVLSVGERAVGINISVLIVAAFLGKLFLCLIQVSVFTHYNNHVRRRDYRIEYIHHKDGEKAFAPL